MPTYVTNPAGKRCILDPHGSFQLVTDEYGGQYRARVLEVPGQTARQDSHVKDDSMTRIHTQNRGPAVHTPSFTPTVANMTVAILHRARIDVQPRAATSLALAITEKDIEEGEWLARQGPREILKRMFSIDGILFDGRHVEDSAFQLGRHYNVRASATVLTATNVYGTLVQAGWDAAGDSTQGWVNEVDNLTYLPEPRHRAVGGELRSQPRGAAAEEMEIEVASENSRVGRYGAKFTVDEVDIANTLQIGNVFPVLVPQQMGSAARALRPDLVYGLVLRNPDASDGNPLFDAAHGNDFDDSALADGTLTDAATAIGNQRENGVALNLRAEYIVTPVVLERGGRKLVRDVDLQSDRNTPTPIVRSDSRLDNGLIDPKTKQLLAGSPTTWYAASAAPGHGIEVSYLDGRNRLPKLSTSVLTQGKFGMTFEVQHAIGVHAVGWRGIARFRAEEDS